MKSERRHELQTNQLADSLAKIPFYLRQYGSRILLGVILVALVIILLHNRSVSRQREARLAVDQLSAAREAIARLRDFDPINRSEKPEERIRRFQDLVRIARESLEGARERMDEPALLAEALIARADLNWTIANYPELPGAGDVKAAPSAEERARALAEARDAYQRVLSNYGDVTMATLSAHLGLAAIAENAGDWDAAKRAYEAVAAGEAYPTAFRDEARRRIGDLDKVRRPVLLVEAPPPMELAPTSAPATQPATAPSTRPASAAPAAAAVMRPAASTRPAATAPATAPAVE